MAYSDQDLFTVSQLAYYEISEKDINDLKDRGLEPTLGNLLKNEIELSNDLKKDLENAKKTKDPIVINKAQGDLDLYNQLTDPDSKYSNWKVVNVRDYNDETGFYGLLIETSPNNAIVGFRGSESKGNQFEKDWANTDFKMLNEGVGVEQQKNAADYMEFINDKYQYDEYATAGHSLGGNLSFFAAITAPSEMRAKIIRSLNGDGPGFAPEFLNNPLYAEGIRDMAGKMDHYQWSLVGAILNPVPGSNYMSIKTKDVVDGDYGLSALMGKHSMTFAELDEYGRVIKGEMDEFAKSIGRLTREMDELPAGVGHVLTGIVEGIMSMSDGQKKLLAGAVIVNVGMFFATHPVIFATTVIVGVTFAVIGWINPEFFGEVLIPFIVDALAYTADTAQRVIEGVKAIITDVLEGAEVASEVINKIIEGVAAGYKAFLEGLSHLFGAGPKLAATPHIKVDTYKLRHYAERLESVKARISSVDSDLNLLYLTEGLLDIINLAIAENLPSKGQINKVINYLQDTAEEFEAAEERIMSI